MMTIAHVTVIEVVIMIEDVNLEEDVVVEEEEEEESALSVESLGTLPGSVLVMRLVEEDMEARMIDMVAVLVAEVEVVMVLIAMEIALAAATEIIEVVEGLIDTVVTVLGDMTTKGCLVFEWLFWKVDDWLAFANWIKLA